MELELTYNEIAYKKRILCRKFTKEETFEVNLSETQPDAVRTVCATALPYMRSKDSENGRMTVTGACDISVVYAADSVPELSVITMSRDFSASAETGELDSESLLTADISVSACEPRLINSRKLLIKLELVFSMTAYADAAVKLPTDISDKDGIETLKASNRLRLPCSVNEKVFTITDSHSFAGIGKIIGSTLSFCADEIKKVGAKAVVRGSAKTRLVYITNSGSVAAQTVESPFSQVVDLDSDEEYCDQTALVTPTGAFVAHDSGGEDGDEVTLELHGVIQCVSYKELEVETVIDAFSPDGEVVFDRGELIFECFRGTERSTADLGVEFKTPVDVKSIDAVMSYPGLPSVSSSEGCCMLSAPASVITVYSSQNDEVFGTLRNAEGKDKLSLNQNGYEYFSSYAEAEHAEFNRTEEGVAVRLSIKTLLEKYEKAVIPIICSAELNEYELKPETPSLIAYRIREGDSLWGIAKKYRCSQESILRANEFADESELKTGKLLLIMKK